MCASAWIQLSFNIGSSQLQRRRLTSHANDQQAPLKWVERSKSMHDWASEAAFSASDSRLRAWSNTVQLLYDVRFLVPGYVHAQLHQ